MLPEVPLLSCSWVDPPRFYCEGFDAEAFEVGAGFLSFCRFSGSLLGFQAGVLALPALFQSLHFCDYFSFDKPPTSKKLMDTSGSPWRNKVMRQNRQSTRPLPNGQPFMTHVITHAIHESPLPNGQQCMAHVIHDQKPAGPVSCFERSVTCSDRLCPYTGVCRSSLFADPLIKALYQDHILGAGSTCMRIQTSPTFTLRYRSLVAECEGSKGDPTLGVRSSQKPNVLNRV
jgi:hypothetical protein